MNLDVTIHNGALELARPWHVQGAGAVTCFEGVVRPTEADQPIAGLKYETYDPMAQRELLRLAQEAMESFALMGVRVEHSRGLVANHQCSFRLRIASAHRKEGLAAMDWVIDRLKRDVPIWKRPVLAKDARPGATQHPASGAVCLATGQAFKGNDPRGMAQDFSKSNPQGQSTHSTLSGCCVAPKAATTSPVASKPAFTCDSPHAAIAAMRGLLNPTAIESLPLRDCAGRVLAQSIVADRHSPACDVSAMDGYAVRLTDLQGDALAVAGEVSIGQSSPAMPTGAALRIFTGGAVPPGCDAVIPREQVMEHPTRIQWPPGLKVAAGQHIRRRGENGAAGETVVPAGVSITSPIAAALASFGIATPRVHQRVRLAVIVTGNEIHDVGETVEPWQLRDGNGPALAAMFAELRWIDCQSISQVPDDPARLKSAIDQALRQSDALLLTGGVSMGDYDYVPATLSELGCRIVFHKLPIRPGKPVLGAIGPEGQVVVGLPGNPVSVMTTARRLALPLLRHLAGHAVIEPPPPLARVVNADDKRLGLHWFRPVRLTGDGEVQLVATRGSGDIISAARSDGVVEIPPNQGGSGPWPFYAWSPTHG